MFDKTIITSFILYLAGVLLYSFDPLMQSIPSVLTDQLMQEFSISSVGVGFIAGSYFYSYNLMQIPAGMLCDKFDLKKILFSSAIICAIGIGLFSISTNFTSAIFARIFMGFGASCAAPIVVMISKEYFDIKHLPILIGFAQLIGNFGAISGQIPMAFLSNKYGWHLSVALLLAIPITLMFISFAFENKMVEKEKNNFVIELKQFAKKLTYVLKDRNNWIIGFYAMFLWTPFYTFSSLWGIPYLREQLNISFVDASKIISIAWIGSGIGSLLIGLCSSHLENRKICIIVSAFIGISIFPFVLISNTQTTILILLFIFGLASSGQALSFAILADFNSKNTIGTAVGFLNTMIMIGPMIIDPIIGWLLKKIWTGEIRNGIPFYTSNDYKIAFIIIPLLFSAALLLTWFYQDKNEMDLI